MNNLLIMGIKVMKRLILVLVCLSIVGCTQSKLRNVAVCQKMAEGYLDSQAVGTYYLVTTQQKEQQESIHVISKRHFFVCIWKCIT